MTTLFKDASANSPNELHIAENHIKTEQMDVYIAICGEIGDLTLGPYDLFDQINRQKDLEYFEENGMSVCDECGDGTVEIAEWS